MTKREKTAAITFIAHGSPKTVANHFMKKLIKKIGGGKRVNLGFLNFGRSSLNTALKTHIDNGYTMIRVIPLFLAPGKHVQNDIPKKIKKFQDKHRNVRLALENILGQNPKFLKLLKKMASV